MTLLNYDPAYDPVEHLDTLKVKIVRHTLQGCNAAWVPERRMVLLDRGLRADLVRPTLAHECDHAEHDDPGGHLPRNEARANLHSALRLINPCLWDDLTHLHTDYDHICLEIGITRRQFLAYFDHRRRDAATRLRFERIGDTVYIDPRLGAGQWKQKVSA